MVTANFNAVFFLGCSGLTGFHLDTRLGLMETEELIIRSLRVQPHFKSPLPQGEGEGVRFDIGLKGNPRKLKRFFRGFRVFRGQNKEPFPSILSQ